VWLLHEPHGVTTQKTPFFIVTAVKTSNLTQLCISLAVIKQIIKIEINYKVMPAA
jgi:hypothetical protein